MLIDSDGTRVNTGLEMPPLFRARVELWAPGDRYYVFEVEGDVLRPLDVEVGVESHYPEGLFARPGLHEPSRQYAEIRVSGRLTRGEGRVGAPQDQG